MSALVFYSLLGVGGAVGLLAAGYVRTRFIGRSTRRGPMPHAVLVTKTKEFFKSQGCKFDINRRPSVDFQAKFRDTKFLVKCLNAQTELRQYPVKTIIDMSRKAAALVTYQDDMVTFHVTESPVEPADAEFALAEKVFLLTYGELPKVMEVLRMDAGCHERLDPFQTMLARRLPGVSLAMAHAFNKQKDLANAIVWAERAVISQTRAAGWHVFLSNLHVGAGHLDAAAEVLRAALRIEPGSTKVHEALIKLSVTRGDISEALTRAQDAVRMFPAEPSFQNHVKTISARLAAAKLKT